MSKMRSEYYDCEPVPEKLARFANERDYTTADLQTDPELRRQLEVEYKQSRCNHDWRGIDTGRMCAKCGVREDV